MVTVLANTGNAERRSRIKARNMRIGLQLQYNRVKMSTILCALVTGALMFAQAPAPQPQKPAGGASAGTQASPKSAGTATGGTKSPASNPKLLNPASLKAQAPPELKVKFTTMKDQSFVVSVVRDWSPNG